MPKMTTDECYNFLLEGVRTAKLATVRKDGRPHVVPIWFDLDGLTIVFTTWHESVKAKNIGRDPRVCICVDDEWPPFSYVQAEGEAEGLVHAGRHDVVRRHPQLGRDHQGHAGGHAEDAQALHRHPAGQRGARRHDDDHRATVQARCLRTREVPVRV